MTVSQVFTAAYNANVFDASLINDFVRHIKSYNVADLYIAASYFKSDTSNSIAKRFCKELLKLV